LPELSNSPSKWPHLPKNYLESLKHTKAAAAGDITWPGRNRHCQQFSQLEDFPRHIPDYCKNCKVKESEFNLFLKLISSSLVRKNFKIQKNHHSL